MLHGHWTPIGFIVILRLPIADAPGDIFDNGIDPPAFSQSRSVNDGLEGGAWLAEGLRRPVELALPVVSPSHHRPDVARLGVNGHEGALQLWVPSLLGLSLHVQVQGRFNLQFSSKDHVWTIAADQLIGHIVDEVRGDAARPLGQLDLLFQGPVQGAFRNVALAFHLPQHQVPPLQRSLAIDIRREGRGGPQDPGEQSALPKGQVQRLFAEIGLSCGVDAVGSFAEIDLVQVAL